MHTPYRLSVALLPIYLIGDTKCIHNKIGSTIKEMGNVLRIFSIAMEPITYSVFQLLHTNTYDLIY